jgi:UDP-glucuronate decarboxylase
VRVLVTGGAGFIGSHLCERLIGDGHTVLCLDNLVTGRLENLKGIIEHPSFTLLRQDVTAPVELEVDRIYHLAGSSSQTHYLRDRIKTTQTHVNGTLNVLSLAACSGARVLLASSSGIYGDPRVDPQTEDYWGHVDPIGNRSCHDEGKRMAESLMTSFHQQHGVDIRIARIFHTYGPRMMEADGRVVTNFVTQALRGEELTIYGTGSQTRSFCFVDDVVDGLVRLMEAKDVTKPVNLGHPAELTVLDLARMVGELAGVEPRLRFYPLPKDDPRQRRPDITRARHLIGWEPRVSLREGLRMTIQDLAMRVRRPRVQTTLRFAIEANRKRFGDAEARRARTGS